MGPTVDPTIGSSFRVIGSSFFAWDCTCFALFLLGGPTLPDSMIRTLIERYETLPYRFPLLAGGGEKLQRLFTKEDLDSESANSEWREYAKLTYPILHAAVPELIHDFLRIKKQYGSAKEKALYAKMTLQDFVTRLLTKRPLVFFNGNDTWMLKDNQKGYMGFDDIGKDTEQPPLVIEDLQSYDEMAISALLGVSVYTPFINEGGRGNRGQVAPYGAFVPKGVYTGRAL